MPVCGRFRKSPQAGPCKTAQRSGCRPHAPYRKPGRRRRRAAFPPAFPYFPADVGHRRADYEAPGFRLPQRDGAFQGSRHFPFSGQGNGTAPGFRERKFSVLPNGFLCESRSRTAPPPRSSFRLIRCLPEAQFPSVLGPAEGEGSGRSSVARRSLRGRVLRFPPLSAGRFPQGFSSSRPTVRHMTYRNRAIVPPRCGLQRAGSVPPRSAERRAVRRPRSGRATADGSSVFRRFQRGRFSRGFSSSRPTVRHMTYRNRAIVPPRCGLQRAGSVPPRSAERRAVRRPRSGRATADGSSVFRRFQRGRFSRGFSSSRPTVRHMTYRNRAIVPPRCGLQRAGSVPPRSAERRAVRRPVPVVQPPTAPRPFMGSAPLAERIPPHRAAGCSDEEAFGDHRLFPAASPLFCRFALTKGRPLLTNGFGALIFAGSPFPVRRPLPEIKSTWGGRRRQHHGRFGRLN